MKHGGPAFPRVQHDDDEEIGREIHPCSAVGIVSSGGMTLRDYFAAQALTGYITRTAGLPPSTVAEWVYQIADALLKEREK
jgi:hypothetical protein